MHAAAVLNKSDVAESTPNGVVIIDVLGISLKKATRTMNTVRYAHIVDYPAVSFHTLVATTKKLT